MGLQRSHSFKISTINVGVLLQMLKEHVHNIYIYIYEMIFGTFLELLSHLVSHWRYL